MEIGAAYGSGHGKAAAWCHEGGGARMKADEHGSGLTAVRRWCREKLRLVLGRLESNDDGGLGYAGAEGMLRFGSTTVMAARVMRKLRWRKGRRCLGSAIWMLVADQWSSRPGY
ncbi:hypothetical protein M0R45_026288 [Rubus argutus]|uniref:Uncharacterized protein n=1 Tax=Rubus argutus TaxID=59490 RepID=A0AAW1WX36_RUBAR